MDGQRRVPRFVFPLCLALALAVWVSGTVDAECPPSETAPAPMSVVGQPGLRCGYYEGGRRWAYYGNCTGKWVLVTVDAASFSDRTFLVPPGEAHNLLRAMIRTCGWLSAR
jgi:hypothetical protein